LPLTLMMIMDSDLVATGKHVKLPVNGSRLEEKYIVGVRATIQ
jgi:hypothetical protein